MEKEIHQAPEHGLEAHGDDISLSDIRDSLHERGFGLGMLIFAIVLALPLPSPLALNILLAVPLIYFSVQMMLGLDAPWIPAWLGNKPVDRVKLATTIRQAAPYIRRIEYITTQRLAFTRTANGIKSIGMVCFICSVAATLPMPLHHWPAVAVVILSIGLLSLDGILIILGMSFAIITLLLTLSAQLFGLDELIKAYDAVRHLL